ncbi:MAG: iron-containing alcohol dehydrogenase, partial [Synergistaceae bacterium]|jgi:alcohol dehydrogenase class IV|nr:iron-containing alcohol dehydrogenase [Synergistaceae bacterium]
MDYSKGSCVEKYANVARAMGLGFHTDAEGAGAAVAEFRRLSEDVGIPVFSSFGIKKDEFREIAAKSYENLSNTSNPRLLGIDDYIEILNRLDAKR